MLEPPIARRVVLTLVVTALFLPITIGVVVGIAALLEQMGDIIGGAVLHRVALGCGILWAIDLICLLLVLALDSLRGPEEPEP